MTSVFSFQIRALRPKAQWPAKRLLLRILHNTWVTPFMSGSVIPSASRGLGYITANTQLAGHTHGGMQLTEEAHGT
jgi:hypothetical protein